MGPYDSLQRSQNPTDGRYSEHVKSSSHPHEPSILILSSHLLLCVRCDLPLSFHTVYEFFITYMRAVCETHLITHSRYIRSTNHKAPYYATFSVFLSLLHFRSQYPLSVCRTAVM